MNFDLHQHIKSQLNSYQEPTRKGTAKGDPIGLSLQKYKACLLCLLKVELREVAKTVGVSYGLLLKWRTEEQFKRFLSVEAEFVADEVLGRLFEHAKSDFENELNIDVFWSDDVQKALLEILPTYFAKSLPKQMDGEEYISAKFIGVLRNVFEKRGDDQAKLDFMFMALMWLHNAYTLRLCESIMKTTEAGKDGIPESIQTSMDMYRFCVGKIYG